MGSGFKAVVAASPQYKSGDARREESGEVHGHSSLLSNLWCTASKPEAPRIYTEHLSMILRTRIRLKRMSAQKNDRSPFLPTGEGAQKGRRGLC